jgi:UDP-2-acetamido-2-deoxy-ribo-hexuluronate aminotransferase
MQFIDLKAQYQGLKATIDAAIQRVLDHGIYVMGPEVSALEIALAEYVGTKHCITVASGTDSLEIALRAWDVGPGDEVITVPFTWISSAEAISLVGATPVFVDITLSDYNLDASKLEEAISPRTKAIMPVSLFGQMPNFKEINAIAARHGIPVLEDAAQSFGASQVGIKSCAISTVGSTSFFPAKPFGCYGDGGALFTDDDDAAEKMRAIRNHGGAQRHNHTMIGMNGRFDTIQAAILLAKLPFFPSDVAARGRIGARYSELLGEFCSVPEISPRNTHVYAQYTIRVANREMLGAKLKETGIPTAVYYPKCLHEQPVFSNLRYELGDFPMAEKASREVISLPMHPFLSVQDQDRVVEAVKAVLKN